MGSRNYQSFGKLIHITYSLLSPSMEWKDWKSLVCFEEALSLIKGNWSLGLNAAKDNRSSKSLVPKWTQENKFHRPENHIPCLVVKAFQLLILQTSTSITKIEGPTFLFTLSALRPLLLIYNRTTSYSPCILHREILYLLCYNPFVP